MISIQTQTQILKEIPYYDLESIYNGLGGQTENMPRLHLIKEISEYDAYHDKRKPGAHDKKLMKKYFDLIKSNQELVRQSFSDPLYQAECLEFFRLKEKYDLLSDLVEERSHNQTQMKNSSVLANWIEQHRVK